MPSGPPRDAATQRPDNAPVAYFITFACYGGTLHGNENGSVDRDHNLAGSRYLPLDVRREAAEAGNRRQQPYVLDKEHRDLVLKSIREVCSYRVWPLHAAHVRSTHVHVVLTATARPERVMRDLKAYASRMLNRQGCDHPRRLRWGRHGSSRYLWKREQVQSTVRYVLEGQGPPMATYPTI